jgi:hypothetical protein
MDRPVQVPLAADLSPYHRGDDIVVITDEDAALSLSRKLGQGLPESRP